MLLVALHRLVAWETPLGNDCLVSADDSVLCIGHLDHEQRVVLDLTEISPPCIGERQPEQRDVRRLFGGGAARVPRS